MEQSLDIFEACRRGDVAAVRRLFEADPSIVHAQDFRGFTPLILAVYNNNVEVTEFLLEQGADPNKQDGAGNTALMGVCFKGYKEIARLLIDAGADVNYRNSNGAPALTFAATFGHLEIAEMLLAAGADVGLRDARGKSPLDHAVIQENNEMVALIQRYIDADSNQVPR